MTALGWLIAAVIAALLWLAFRRKRVADRVEEFEELWRVEEFIFEMDFFDYDCFIEKVAANRWQVRCYRRKENV